MADIAEQQEVAHEISDAISRPMGFGDEIDEVRTDQIQVKSQVTYCCNEQSSAACQLVLLQPCIALIKAFKACTVITLTYAVCCY